MTAKWIIHYEVPYEGGYKIECQSDEECITELERMYSLHREGAVVQPAPTVEYDWFEFVKLHSEGKLPK